MLTIDKEASVEAIKAGERTFARFGSTRLLGYGMLVGGVVMVLRSTDKPDPVLLSYGMGIIAVGFAVLALSYILRPHDPKPRHIEAVPDVPEAKGTEVKP